MSILDEIRDGLGTLLDRVGGDDGPIPDVSNRQIVAELERRARARDGQPLGVSHPIALRAASNPKARADRDRLARKREAVIRKKRAQREASEQAARDAAFEEMKRRAAQEPAGGYASSSSSSSSSSAGANRASWRDRVPLGRDPKIAKHYETLNLPYGATFDEVKKQFRRLMRKYHPDMHTGSPDKAKAANELSRQLSVAYSALEDHLSGK